MEQLKLNSQRRDNSVKVSKNYSIQIPSTQGSLSALDSRLHFNDVAIWKHNPSSSEVLSNIAGPRSARSHQELPVGSGRPSSTQNSQLISNRSYRPTKQSTNNKQVQDSKNDYMIRPQTQEIDWQPPSATTLSVYKLDSQQITDHLVQHQPERFPSTIKYVKQKPAHAVSEMKKSVPRETLTALASAEIDLKREILSQTFSYRLESPKFPGNPSSLKGKELASNSLLHISDRQGASTRADELTTNSTEKIDFSAQLKSPVLKKPLGEGFHLPLNKISEKKNSSKKSLNSSSREQSAIISKPAITEQADHYGLKELVTQRINTIESDTFAHIPKWLLGRDAYFENLKANRDEQKHKVVSILKKEANLRKFWEISILTRFLQGVVIFSSFTASHLMELTEQLKLQYYKKGEYLCHQDDIAREIWVIIEGDISIRNHEGVLGSASAGDLLGRQAFEKKGIRAASLVVASEEAFVASISEREFKNFLSHKETIELSLAEKAHFLQGLPVFRLLSDEKIFRVALNIHPKKYFKNEVIYNKNDASGQVYILYSGEVVRETELKIIRGNIWPIGSKEWKIRQFKKYHEVNVPLKSGDFFGYKETFTNMLRKEKVLAPRESVVFVLTRELIEECKIIGMISESNV